MRVRYCPLCDADAGDARCARHGVPTLDFGGAEPGARLEAGVTVAGRYLVEGLLDQGGMGALLSARDLRTGEDVVLKVLRGQRVVDPAYVRRFFQEALVAAALRHPNLVDVIEFGVDPPTQAPFLAMERVHGRTLRTVVREDGPLDEARAAGVFRQIALALAEAHARGVLHRDLKPSNVMLVGEGGGEARVKVLDFGLAKVLHGADLALTAPGKTVGTPAYMAPEQITQRPQDARTDLYGLGCMLHVALTGQPPFAGKDAIDVMRRQLRDPPPSLPAALADGASPSEALLALHRSLLDKSPARRPASAEAVVRLLEALAPARPVLRRPTTAARPEPSPLDALEPEASSGDLVTLLAEEAAAPPCPAPLARAPSLAGAAAPAGWRPGPATVATLGGAVLAFAVVLIVALAPVRPGRVEIRSKPSGAEVWLEGAPAGLTPLRVPTATVARRLELRMPGFVPLGGWVEAGRAGVLEHALREK